MVLSLKRMILCASGVTLALTGVAHADASLTAGPANAVYYGVSGNGQIVYGSNSSGVSVYWDNNGVEHSIDDTVNNSHLSNLQGMNTDGSILYGIGVYQGMNNSPMYLQNGNYYYLTPLAGATGGAIYGGNDDGTVFVGASNINNGEATKWQNGTAIDLGFKAGDDTSVAKSVSTDGTKIVGYSWHSNGGYNPSGLFWNNGTMQVLANATGYTDGSTPEVISRDGNVIAGEGIFYGPSFAESRAVVWRNGVATTMDDLPSGYNIQDVKGISDNGAILVGNAHDSNFNSKAVYWKTSDGSITTVLDRLNSQGVNVTGWDLTNAKGVDGSGNVVVGYGTNNGNVTPFIANIATGGLTTPAAMSQSLGSTIVVSQQANQTALSGLGQSLFTAEHLSALSVSMAQPSMAAVPTPSSPVVTHADGSQSFAINNDDRGYGLFTPYQPSLLSRISVYTVGSVGAGQNNNLDNNDMNGTVGASLRLDHDLSLGVGILGANSHTNMAFNGKSDLSARGVSTVFSYLPQYGLRAFGTAFMADLDLTIVRGYTNGSGLSASRGTPDGNAHGAAAEVGYAVPVNTQVTVTPFVDTRWSRTSVDAYSETGGPFNADFSTQKNTNVTSHLGTELGYQLNPKTNLYTRVSWGHRLSGDGSSFTASTSGVTQSLGLDPGDRNWAEGAVGTNYQATNKIRLSAELSGRTNNTQEPVATLTVGANISF